MNLEETWREIADGKGQPSASGLLARRIDPESPDDLFVGLRTLPGTRCLFLRLASEPRLSRNALVQSIGFRTALTRFDGDPPGAANLIIESTDPSFNDLFGVLSAEIVGNVQGRAVGEPQLTAFLACLQRWKRFFDSSGVEGLGDEALLGLLAELSFLKDFVLPNIDSQHGAITAWVGPDPLSKDFQFSTCSIEVKGSSSREHSKVKISGERQLDGAGIAALFLFVLMVERVGSGGITVPLLVDEIRAILGVVPARTVFEEKLVACGYHDAHRPKYIEKPYLVRGHRFLHVSEGFPRLIPPLPNGIGDLAYSLSLSACEPYRRKDQEVTGLISQAVSHYDA